MLTALAIVGVLAVLFVAAVVATREGPVLADAPADIADVSLPAGALRPEDLQGVRFGLTVRGYRMSEVDEVLDRVAAELAARDERISALQQGAAAVTSVAVPVSAAAAAPLPVSLPAGGAVPAPPADDAPTTVLAAEAGRAAEAASTGTHLPGAPVAAPAGAEAKVPLVPIEPPLDRPPAAPTTEGELAQGAPERGPADAREAGGAPPDAHELPGAGSTPANTGTAGGDRAPGAAVPAGGVDAQGEQSPHLSSQVDGAELQRPAAPALAPESEQPPSGPTGVSEPTTLPERATPEQDPTPGPSQPPVPTAPQAPSNASEPTDAAPAAGGAGPATPPADAPPGAPPAPPRD